MTFTTDDRKEILKTISYSRDRINNSKEYLLNQIAVKINFGCNTFSQQEVNLILEIIGIYLNQAAAANSSHIELFHRIDVYSNRLS